MTFLARVGFACVVACLLAPPGAAAQETPQAPLFCPPCPECSADMDALRVVHVKMYNQSRLGESGLNTLIDVANRIWLPYGVSVEPVSSPAGAVAVVVGAGQPEPVSRSGRPVLGDTLFHNGHATAYIRLWLGAAEAVASMKGAPGPVFSDLPADQRDTILLQMMGVAFAHELGHYLLDTGQHSTRGLLRAAITIGELQRPELTRLELTESQQRLMCRASK